MLATLLRKRDNRNKKLGLHPSKRKVDKKMKWGQRCNMGEGRTLRTETLEDSNPLSRTKQVSRNTYPMDHC